jgi:hypothetical protein
VSGLRFSGVIAVEGLNAMLFHPDKCCTQDPLSGTPSAYSVTPVIRYRLAFSLSCVVCLYVVYLTTVPVGYIEGREQPEGFREYLLSKISAAKRKEVTEEMGKSA